MKGTGPTRVVDIFDEVDEELRADRLREFGKRYGGMIVAGMVAVVAAAGGWQAWRWWDARQTLAQAEAYLAATREADAIPPPSSGDTGDAAKRQQAADSFLTVAAHGNPGYATLARLRAAALKADAGDRAGALQLWDQVAGDGSADPALRDAATLLWARAQVDDGDAAAIEARLKPLIVPGNPWRPLAEETMALLDLRTGRTDAAREILKRLSTDLTSPEGVRGRASVLLARLGG